MGTHDCELVGAMAAIVEADFGEFVLKQTLAFLKSEAASEEFKTAGCHISWPS